MAATDVEETKRTGMGMPILAGIVLALAGGGGAYWAVSSGLVTAFAAGPQERRESEAGSESPVAFVPMSPVTIAIGPPGTGRHLVFAASLEVPQPYAGDVAHLEPRILDVLNGFLRVVALEELEDPRALMRLRTQMLRRVQIVAGPDRVSDILISQFTVN